MSITKKRAIYPLSPRERVGVRGVKILMLLVLVATLSGCNTLQGFGRDLQGLGSAIEDATS